MRVYAYVCVFMLSYLLVLVYFPIRNEKHFFFGLPGSLGKFLSQGRTPTWLEAAFRATSYFCRSHFFLFLSALFPMLCVLVGARPARSGAGREANTAAAAAAAASSTGSAKDEPPPWRLFHNRSHGVVPTYPLHFVVPAVMTDSDVRYVI